jgi:acetyl esterase/lipase
MKMLLAALFSMSLFISCTETTGTGVSLHASPLNLRNVAYGKDSAQRIDIYLPADRSISHTKSILLVHGGGWNAGDKSDLNGYIDSFKKRMPGYAIFNINYRLVAPGKLFPTQEIDLKSAIEFISKRSEEYGINKNKLVLLGVSAGAHLALLQAYKNHSPKIAAVIDLFGPTDLETMYNHPWHPLVPVAL